MHRLRLPREALLLLHQQRKFPPRARLPMLRLLPPPCPRLPLFRLRPHQQLLRPRLPLQRKRRLSRRHRRRSPRPQVNNSASGRRDVHGLTANTATLKTSRFHDACVDARLAKLADALG